MLRQPIPKIMKTGRLVLSLVAACCPAWMASAAVDAGQLAARRALESGLVRIVSMAPLRMSAGAVVTRMVRPRFPHEMQRVGMPGYVRLEVAIDDEGRVVNASVLESSGREFAREALRAVGQWQFVAVEDPQPDRLRIVRVPIQFDLLVAAN